jgi:hypothetical protein
MSNPILAINPAPTTSTKYQFQSSTEIIDIFKSRGFTLAKEQFARLNKKNGVPSLRQGYQKHLLRFDHPNLNIDGGNRVQVVVKNSHDGTIPLWIGLGVYRLVCTNGLMVGTDFYSSTIKHIGVDFKERVYLALDSIFENAEKVKETVIAMQNTKLSNAQMADLIQEVIKLKLGDDFSPNLVDLSSFRARRSEDQADDLYTVLNRLQEVLIRGGLKYQVEDKDTEGNVISIRRNTTRKVTGIQAEIELNQAIFNQALKLVA